MSQSIASVSPADESACAACGRREFLSNALMLAAGSLLLGACGDGVIGVDNSQILGAVNLTIPLAAYPALASVGGIARISGTSSPVAVARTAATTFEAFSMICPHQGTTVNISGAGFQCPNHGARFDSHGNWVQSQQRTSNLTRIAVTYDEVAGSLKLG